MMGVVLQVSKVPYSNATVPGDSHVTRQNGSFSY